MLKCRNIGPGVKPLPAVVVLLVEVLSPFKDKCLSETRSGNISKKKLLNDKNISWMII
jgi:hypothetical protein